MNYYLFLILSTNLSFSPSTISEYWYSSFLETQAFSRSFISARILCEYLVCPSTKPAF